MTSRHNSHTSPKRTQADTQTSRESDSVCPVCGAPLIQEKCKVVCRSPQCVYRIIFNCSEF